ncbi:hypothetical protein DDE01_05600 [Desulfovibrio desulfuricans]|nr:hypothetical protein DDE01_05600 [Desulfovibrio desulfuricans]
MYPTRCGEWPLTTHDDLRLAARAWLGKHRLQESGKRAMANPPKHATRWGGMKSRAYRTPQGLSHA